MRSKRLLESATHSIGACVSRATTPASAGETGTEERPRVVWYSSRVKQGILRPKEGILRRIFRIELARFVRVFPDLAGTTLVIKQTRCMGEHCGFRDLAYQQGSILEGPSVITVNARLARFPIANVRGVIRHELGHACDDRIESPRAEQRADDIAEIVTGQKIRYDKDLVQTVGIGSWPRPRNLHR